MFRGRARAVGANSGQMIRKDQKNPTATFKEPGAKTGYYEQKQGTEHVRCTQYHQRGGQNI